MAQYIWLSNPTSNSWNDKNNWTPKGGPRAGDTAVLGHSGVTQMTFASSGDAQVGEIVFNAENASKYTLQFGPSSAPGLVINGRGVTNASSQEQTFIVAASSKGINNAQLVFAKSASAGGPRVSYTAGPETPQSAGGGVIAFIDNATAGSASFTALTGFAAPPKEGSTVGGEISFSDSSSAGTATFTTLGTTGSDGDTFGTVGFHGNSTAAKGTFTNKGGTVSGGDGGNTQFYDQSSAANGVFNNLGGTSSGANGGDVAFDGTATGGQGTFNNYAATAAGGHGGVTSFNNNPPQVTSGGASAGKGTYNNYGAESTGQGGGGHTEFTGKYGSPTASNATINNYGGKAARASGGYTIFQNKSSAGSATLLAAGGTNGGSSGTIYFEGESTAYDESAAKGATIKLLGGDLVLEKHAGALEINVLEWNGGAVSQQLGKNPTPLVVHESLRLESKVATFSFAKSAGFSFGTRYTVLTAPNLSRHSVGQFAGNSIDGVKPVFSFSGNTLIVVYPQD